MESKKFVLRFASSNLQRVFTLRKSTNNCRHAMVTIQEGRKERRGNRTTFLTVSESSSNRPLAYFFVSVAH